MTGTRACSRSTAGSLRSAIADHGGTEVATEGDSFFAVFPAGPTALEATAAAQRELAAGNWPPGVNVRVRMGVHTGRGRARRRQLHRARRSPRGPHRRCRARRADRRQRDDAGERCGPAAARHAAARPRRPPAQGPRTAGARVPARRDGPAGRVSRPAEPRRAGQQPAGPAHLLRRSRGGDRRGPGAPRPAPGW